MKGIWVLICTFFLGITSIVSAQPEDEVVRVFENAPEHQVVKYLVNSQHEKRVHLWMHFAKSAILTPEELAKIQNGKVYAIDLVYTDFPKGKNFDQLNQSRLADLLNLRQDLFSDSTVTWNVFKQTGCATQEEAERYFHGLVIHFEKPKVWEVVTTKGPAQLKLHPDDLEAREQKRRDYLDKLLQKLMKTNLGMDIGTDSSTLDIFERNAKSWKNVVIVSDWTGSMYPYTLQVLKWQVKENAHHRIAGYVFFNDGDLKTTDEKLIGNTGGLYVAESTRPDRVLATMKEVKKNGDGGDLQENDIEALLFAKKQFEEADEFILIADNKSRVRDMALLQSFDKPVRIVLSRVDQEALTAINPQYISLAILTNGSIHTHSLDFTNIELLKDYLSENIASSPLESF
ncbi:hypothetical protein AAG747_15665 [Rapidithrix thailandica]|uniref:VWA domain-containing protein n=1 Tax=Rapidithrix thailandica TaxID=413964 RepID=A0AAW9S8L7_9BACT